MYVYVYVIIIHKSMNRTRHEQKRKSKYATNSSRVKWSEWARMLCHFYGSMNFVSFLWWVFFIAFGIPPFADSSRCWDIEKAKEMDSRLICDQLDSRVREQSWAERWCHACEKINDIYLFSFFLRVEIIVADGCDWMKRRSWDEMLCRTHAHTDRLRHEQRGT